MKSEKLKNSCFRSKKVKLKKFIPHRWVKSNFCLHVVGYML